ncbi:MAG: NlpC/P60 family protein, partial [Oscillospiraceae bacterium]
MSKRESRLKFTEKELNDPVIGPAARKAEKAADKAEKAQQKIPAKKVIRPELVPDPKTGKIKVQLHFEEQAKKPPSKLAFTAKEAPGEILRGQLRREIKESENENVAVEAVARGLDVSESGTQLLQNASHHAKLQPYRAAALAEKKLDDANVKALQKKAEAENPTSNPISKWRQRQAIKKQYAAEAKAAYASGEKVAARATEATKKAGDFVVQHKRGFLLVLGFAFLLVFMLNVFSSCSMIVEGVGSAIAAGSYASQESDIQSAEAAYSAMEDNLQHYLDTYEDTHSYDEYHFDLDAIEHDPYVLTSILSALHPGEWTLAQVLPTLDMLFDKQYILTEEVETETRYRTEIVTGERHAQDPITGEYLYDRWGDPIMEEYEYEDEVPYTYYICTVTLENFNLSHVPVYVMSEDQLSMYALYMSTLGYRPDLFPDSEYIDLYFGNTGLEYEVPPAAMEDEQFAAMITEAQKYLGYPYVWGGSSPSTSFDCSGYVCWVINHSGWNVGRTSAQGLFNICTTVSSANVKPGDLVFFKGTYDTPGISHVGIYVGNSVMIHCGDPISYTNLNSNYWQTHFY